MGAWSARLRKFRTRGSPRNQNLPQRYYYFDAHAGSGTQFSEASSTNTQSRLYPTTLVRAPSTYASFVSDMRYYGILCSVQLFQVFAATLSGGNFVTDEGIRVTAVFGSVSGVNLGRFCDDAFQPGLQNSGVEN